MIDTNICEGNPGALAFLTQAFALNSIKAEQAFNRLVENNITGYKLYLLWNDCCDRNTEKALNIATTHTIENILEHLNLNRSRGIPYD